MSGRRDGGPRSGVLVAAEGHEWEPGALAAVAAAGDLVMLRRCLDLTDLLAVAASGTAQVAVVAATPGLDRDLVDRLAAHQVATVAVLGQPGGPAALHDDEAGRLSALGVAVVLSADEVAGQLVDALRRALSGVREAPEGGPAVDVAGPASRRGHVVAVWGATGAPGRTTVATGLASALAQAGRSTLLVDADPFGGAVGQHLGILDETSGLLAASRHANSGTLTPDRLRAGARSVAPSLDVLTGLPRPDRWTEVRAANLTEVVERSAETSDLVVVDAGFGGEVSSGVPATTRSRDLLVTAVLRAADEVLLVGSAEPVGLTRLARLLVDGRQVLEHGPSHVVVNRMRPGLGWREPEIVDMVARVCPRAPVHFVPFDLDAADRAMQSGRSPVELGASRLSTALVALGAAVAGAPADESRHPRRRSLLTRV